MADLLRCPYCHDPLRRTGRVWRCGAGHTFDVARQGYVNLAVGGSPHPGDNARMLDHRAEILAAGHLEAVSGALADACRDGLPAGALVEVGAGTAHHLARVGRALGDDRPAVALDVSVAAAKRAARADLPDVTAVVADVWQPWPLLDGIAAAVLSVFAPRNPHETARVLGPGGRFVVATPAPDHLAGITGPLGLLDIDADKGARVRDDLRDLFNVVEVREVRDVRTVERGAARALALMGPSAHHVSERELDERLSGLPPEVEVTVAVEVTRLEPRTD